MAVLVTIPAPLRGLCGGATRIACAPGSVADVIDEIDALHAGVRERLCLDGELRRFVNVFVAGEDVRFADGIATPVRDGQQVTILPAVAGG